MKKYSNKEHVDLTQFDRSEERRLAHWRGFTKFMQPDGSVVAVSSESDSTGYALGPARDGRSADLFIMDFYDDSKGEHAMTTTNERRHEHTPGPWRVLDAGTATDEHAKTIRSDGGAWIANILRQGTEADRIANASLIAAAPDLLAACEVALDFAYSLLPVQPKPHPIQAQLRAAIAKATGGAR